MGLLDVINGMQNGPRGQPRPQNPGAGGGMSKITMALLGLLAYKAYKNFGSAQQPLPAGTGAGPSGGGSLGDILGGLFAGRGSSPGASGVTPGSVLSRGVGNLVEDLQKGGQGGIAQSWVGKGPNQDISSERLQAALGEDAIDALTKRTGMERVELLDALRQYLPGVIDHLTPHGRLPTEDEAARAA